MPNKLQTETSLYLQQHAKNPVDWYSWGVEALQAAKQQNKPILLSVGYASCHWCHVMAHESFENPQTAELMNRFFMNIKVDREERPDIDTLYQEALRLTGRVGGWPLTMFLTPEGRPFYGGTYFPDVTDGLTPNFREILWQVANMWRKDSDEAIKKSKNLEEGMRALATSQSGMPDMAEEKIGELAQELLRYIDPDHGGFGRQNKFPNVTALQLMWQTWRMGAEENTERKLLAAGVRLSLDHMCQGGLYDHVGGGFFRYTVDPAWHTPHFEKMLYDNALLLALLTAVWRETKNPLYEARIRQTVTWLLAEMQLENGAFAASVDADTPEGEGAFYTWSAAELKEILGEQAAPFMAAYGAVGQGNFAGRNILNRLHDAHGGIDGEKTHQAALETLKEKRRQRPAPTRDPKCLVDWNGLMIASLTEAALTFAEPLWLQAAKDAYKAVLEHAACANGTALAHSWCNAKPQQQSFIDDYAAMIHAALTLYEATAEKTYREQAERWALWVIEHFEDAKGGFFKAEKTNKDLFTPLKEGRDGAWPCANGLMVQNFARLQVLSGNILWREQGRRTFAAFSDELKAYVFGYTSLLVGQSLLVSGVQLVLVGDVADEGFVEMQQAIWQAPQPNRMLTILKNGQKLSPLHPAFGKEKIEGKPTLYVCVGKTCGAPLTSAAAVTAALREFSALKGSLLVASSSKTA